MTYMKVIVLWASLLLFQPVWAIVMSPVLIDKVCVEVGTQDPILRSEVLALAQKDGLTPKLAQAELVKGRILPVYAKQKLTFNLDQIYKAAQEHVVSVMKRNNMSQPEFENKLKESYQMTLAQFLRDTKYHLLKSQVMAELRKQVVIGEDELQKAIDARIKANAQEIEIVFINVKTSGPVSADLSKAKAIKKQIDLLKSLDKVKSIYDNDKSVSFSGPVSYEKGKLLDRYETELRKYANQGVTEPFADNGGTTMIWKIKKKIHEHKLSETALEKERNSLYEEATKQLFDAVVSSELANSPVISNCAW